MEMTLSRNVIAQEKERFFFTLIEQHKWVIEKLVREKEAAARGGNRDSDDYRQEALLQAWKSFAKFDMGGKCDDHINRTFNNWLRSVASTSILKYRIKVGLAFLKMTNYKRETFSAPVTFFGTAEEMDWFTDLESESVEENYSGLYKAIEDLPAENAKVLLLHMNGNSYSEIASRLRITERLVKDRINHAIFLIRKNQEKYFQNIRDCRNKIAYRTQKPIQAFDSEGQLVLNYDSMREAIRDGHHGATIRDCISGKREVYKDLFWKYKDVERRSGKIIMMDMTENIIDEFASIDEAANKTGVKMKIILQCVNGHVGSYHKMKFCRRCN